MIGYPPRGMRSLLISNHFRNDFNAGLSARATAGARAAEVVLEIALELEHISQVIRSGETQTAVNLGIDGAVAHLLAERIG